MRKIAVALGAVAALTASQAFAQAQRNEVSAFASFQHTTTSTNTGGSDITTNNYLVNGSYGYYFSPQLVGTVGLTYNLTEGGAGDAGKSSTTFLEVGAKYYFGNFRRSAWVPFVTGAVGVVSFSNSDSGSGGEFHAGGGVSYFLTESTSIDPSIEYLYYKFSIGGTDITNKGYQALLRMTTRF
jgi:hypothetical protein